MGNQRYFFLKIEQNRHNTKKTKFQKKEEKKEKNILTQEIERPPSS